MKYPVKKIKRQAKDWKKGLQTKYPTKDFYLEYKVLSNLNSKKSEQSN